jgi:integrase/recombinase XerD
MTPLRQRMSEDLQLRGLSERTQEMSVRAVRQLAEHSHQAPDHITEEELRDYFLSLKNDRHSSRAASTLALCGIKFFCAQTLKRTWSTRTFLRAPREQKLPSVLSVDEIRTILAPVQLLRYRVCRPTISSCGLRLQKGTPLQIPAIASARMLVHIRAGKGAKARSVPLPQRTRLLLRHSWATPRPPVCGSFPRQGGAASGWRQPLSLCPAIVSRTPCGLP